MKKKVKKGVKKAVRKKPVKKVKRRVIKMHVKRHPKKLSGKKPKKHVKRPVKKHHSYHIRTVIKNTVLKRPKKISERKITMPKKITEEFSKEGLEKTAMLRYFREYLKQFFEKDSYYGKLFSRTYELIKKRRGVFIKTLCLDLLLLVVLVLMFRGSLRFMPKETTSALYRIFGVPFVFTTAILLFLIGVFMYSFIKYKVLFIIESMLENVRFSLERFDKFLVLNSVVLGTGFLVFFIMYITAYFVNSGIKPIIWVVFTLISAFIYSFINISHWLFAHEPKFRKTMKRTLIIMTEGFKKYAGITGLMFGVSIVYLLIAFGIGWLFKIAEGDITAYKKIAIGAGIIIFYITLAYNRICYYFAVEKLKNEIKY